MPFAPPLTFPMLFDASANASAIFDREMRFVGANHAYLELTGLGWPAIQGHHLFDVLAIVDASDVRASFDRAVATAQRSEAPFVRYANGHTCSIVNVPLREDGGRASTSEGVACVMHQVADVTGLRPDAVDALGLAVLGRASRASEQLSLLRQVFAQSPGFVALLRGPTHRFELANAAYLSLIGRDDGVLGQTVAEALPEVVGQGFIDVLDRVLASGQPFVGRGVEVALNRAADQPSETRIVDFVYQPIRAEGATVGIFVLGQDITEARQAELDRSRLASEYRKLIELAPMQVWTANPSGQLESVNHHTIEFMHRTAEEIVGDNWQSVVHPDDLTPTLERWTQSLTSGKPYEQLFRLRRHDGAYRWHIARATPVRDASGFTVAWIGCNTDIHDERTAREQLLSRNAYEEKLIGVVSHDLRNPLATIALAVGLISGDKDPSANKARDLIQAAVSRAERLISDLMDFAQARNGTFPIQPTPTNLVALIHSAVETAGLEAQPREVSVEHHGPAMGSWDEGRLVQVLVNLIGNAFQHTPAKAAIRVTSRIDGERTTVTVFNAGSPIAPDDLGRIFDPFARGKSAQTKRGRSIGLGLYIAQQIARAHGGEITVDSGSDGTAFTVHLPTETTSPAK